MQVSFVVDLKCAITRGLLVFTEMTVMGKLAHR